MLDTLLFLSIIAAFSGICAGILAGLFGIGGGVIIVPALFHLFQAVGCSAQTAIAMAIASSLCCILPTSLASLRAHYRLGNLDVRRLQYSIIPLVLGAITGSLAVAHYAGLWLNWVFAGLLLFVAAFTAYRLLGKAKGLDKETERESHGANLLISIALYLIALLSALAGVGGGALGGPLLMALGYSAHKAVGTAAGFGFAIALPAVLNILLFADTPADAPRGSIALVNLPACLLLAVCSSFAAPYGAKLGRALPAKILGFSLVGLLALLSLRMFIAA
ncbi:Uncharacterized membrane protein YfcA [Alteromonadaceae bacterium Bs31]|nr:Uncharacterized membrane protein YfcA [Alteromonadaceae bacterium Bs31]